MQLVLGAAVPHGDATRHRPPPAADRRCCTGSRPTSAPTVARRAPALAAATTPTAPRSDDDSIQVHACHGRARQVEVLRDAVLHLLEDDPTLEPRDMIVMCPDIETFAPLIQATFGATTSRRRADLTLRDLESASPTARSARPTPSSASWPSSSTWPRRG